MLDPGTGLVLESKVCMHVIAEGFVKIPFLRYSF